MPSSQSVERIVHDAIKGALDMVAREHGVFVTEIEVSWESSLVTTLGKPLPPPTITRVRVVSSTHYERNEHVGE